MSEITITSFVDYKYKEELSNLQLIPRGTDSRNINHWDVKRWWYEGRTIYEACARVNNNDNGDVLYIASSTNNPYLKIEFDGSNYTFDSDRKRQHIDRILIKTSSNDIDIQVPLRGIIGASTGSEPSEPLDIAPNGGANWVGTNVYVVGQTVEAKTAIFAGGLEPIVYRCRFQIKEEGQSNWVSTPWVDTTNAKNSIFYELTVPGRIKFQSQGKDASEAVLYIPIYSNTAEKVVTA